MHLDRSMDNIERYKVAKKTTKRAVSEAMGQISRTDGGSISTNSSMKTVGARPLS
jgi:hypothetical protein